jgi:hypothetical protein
MSAVMIRITTRIANTDMASDVMDSELKFMYCSKLKSDSEKTIVPGMA